MNRVEAWCLSPEHPANVRMARVLVAATALWVVLSRFDLPGVLTFPAELWETVPFARRARFGLLLPVAAERTLWIALHLSLIAAIAGVAKRWSCIVSGLLLYHLAPLETIVWTPNPYLRGLTLPCLALLILGFAESKENKGWGLRLTQFLVCCLYLLPGYAKLFHSGTDWASARNIRLYLLGLDQFLEFRSPLVHAVADSEILCTFIGIFGIVFELLFTVVLFWRASRWFFIPVAILFHIANSVLFHIFFQNIALLLLFVDWEAVRRAIARKTAAPNGARPDSATTAR